MRPTRASSFPLVAVLTCFAACSDSGGDHHTPPVEAPDPPELLAGERLFLEQRFAQYFADHAGGFLNLPLAFGDPALDTIRVNGVDQPSPFAGGTMSCGACHMVDQALELEDAGMRTYNDFALQSAVTDRGDGQTHSVRNSPPLVNASIARATETVFHLDGEFSTLQQLVVDTLEGRNYGWLANETALAEAHIAAVIRQDDGAGELASEFGAIPYATLLDSNALGVPEEFALPPAFQIDMLVATDAQIVDAVAALIAAYTEDLAFARDGDDHYSTSPFDAFLRKNQLPQAPDVGETGLEYARRLRDEIDALASPKYVTNGSFEFHEQSFRFGPDELEGLRIFLRETPTAAFGGVGACVECHTPPDFTDFQFHNVGFTQDDYDALHGPGSFFALLIPDLATRDGDPDAYLPPTPSHPAALGPYRAALDAFDPDRMDLGLWNIFANADFPAQQAPLLTILDDVYGPGTSVMSNAQLLPKVEALFKTPGLRDLSHSGPYGHSGGFATLSEVVNHYVEFGALARSGFVRNPDPRLMNVDLVFADIAKLVAFLRSLNEDYS